ncbi:hypothetical protein BDR26DRAFT_851647 [Obelidium mucronatum]|nr:hypothetical protein BDR26DRAFT_851647 [Obelidium mucronatum]
MKQKRESLKSGEVEFKPGASPNTIISLEQDPSLYSIRSRATSAASSTVSKVSSAARSKRREKLSIASQKQRVSMPDSNSLTKDAQNVTVISVTLKTELETSTIPSKIPPQMSSNAESSEMVANERPKVSLARIKRRSKQSSVSGSVTSEIEDRPKWSKRSQKPAEISARDPPLSSNPPAQLELKTTLKPNPTFEASKSKQPSSKTPANVVSQNFKISDTHSLHHQPSEEENETRVLPTPKATPEPIVLSTLQMPAKDLGTPSSSGDAPKSPTFEVHQSKNVSQQVLHSDKDEGQGKLTMSLKISQEAKPIAQKEKDEEDISEVYSEDEFEPDSFEVISTTSIHDRDHHSQEFIEEVDELNLERYQDSDVDNEFVFEVVNSRSTAPLKTDSRTHFYNSDSDIEFYDMNDGKGAENVSESNNAFTDTESAVAAYDCEFEVENTSEDHDQLEPAAESSKKPAWRPNSRLSNIGFEYYPPRPKSPYSMSPPKIHCKPSGPKPPFSSPVGKRLSESSNLKTKSKDAQAKVTEKLVSGRCSPYAAIISRIHYPTKLNQANKKHERWPLHMPGTRSFSNLPLKVIQKARRHVKEESLIEKTKRRIKEEAKFRQISRGNWSSKASKFISQRKQPAWAKPYRVPERKPVEVPPETVAKSLEKAADNAVNACDELQSRIEQIKKLKDAYGSISTPAHVEALIKLSQYWLKLGDYKEALRTASLAKKATKKMFLQDSEKVFERINEAANDNAPPKENFFQLVKHKKYGDVMAPVRDIDLASQLEATVDLLINKIINTRVRSLGVEGLARVSPPDGRDYIQLNLKHQNDSFEANTDIFPVHEARRQVKKNRPVSSQQAYEEQKRINREKAAKYSESLEVKALKKLVKSLSEEVELYKVPRVERIMKALDKGKAAKDLVCQNPQKSRDKKILAEQISAHIAVSLKSGKESKAPDAPNVTVPTVSTKEAKTSKLMSKNDSESLECQTNPKSELTSTLIHSEIEEAKPKTVNGQDKLPQDYCAVKVEENIGEKLNEKIERVENIQKTEQRLVEKILPATQFNEAEMKPEEKFPVLQIGDQSLDSQPPMDEPARSVVMHEDSPQISPGSTRRNSNEDDFSKLADELFG